MTTLEKLDRMSAKIETIRAFVETHGLNNQLVCVHSINDDALPTSIYLYDKDDAFARFGADGWERVSKDGGKYVNLERNIDGVSVGIYRVEEAK